MYRQKKYKENGFKTQQEFIETVIWLRLEGCSLQSIADLYGVTKTYVAKLSPGQKPQVVKNRKPKSLPTRPETSA